MSVEHSNREDVLFFGNESGDGSVNDEKRHEVKEDLEEKGHISCHDDDTL